MTFFTSFDNVSLPVALAVMNALATQRNDHNALTQMREKQKKRRRIHPYGQRLLVPIFLLLISASCSSNAPTSILVREPLQVPSTVNDIFARDGKSDYLLMADDGYSFRLIYLCENRVLNFIDEPENNPVLVSVQPVLDTAVEGRLSPDDRRRIWACMERRVLEEKSRVDEIKSRVVRDRAQVDNEARSVRAEMERRISEIAERKRLEAENQRRAEEEKRRAEEERLRKSQEDQRKAADEEKKLRAYKVSEREDPAPPAAPLKATETGVFLIMNEARLHEEPSEFSRVVTRSAKYDVLEVLNSRKDPAGNYWHQVYLGERLVSDRGKRSGWSPEERSFWVKNRLPVWVYPGDIASVHQAKPIRLRSMTSSSRAGRLRPPKKPFSTRSRIR